LGGHFWPRCSDAFTEAATNPFKAFGKAKKICREFCADPNRLWLAWVGVRAKKEKLFGCDPRPYGSKNIRANVERSVGYSLDQGLMAKKMAVEELFMPLN
jgi:hypothetical protein